MNIQSNINNMLSIAGLLYTQSPGYKAKLEARSLQAKGESAQAGLEDIYKGYRELKEGKRAPYSETEIQDITARIPQLNREIYDTVIAENDPRLGKYINKSALGKRSDRSSMLSEMEDFETQNKLAQIGRAKKSAEAARISRTMEKQASDEFIRRINAFDEPKMMI